MKHHAHTVVLLVATIAAIARPAWASIESNVISLVDREGFRWKSAAGDFELNPYLLVQSYLQGKFVSGKWLNLADQDSVTEVGFGSANALLGMAGRGFGKLAFNLTLNAACGAQPCLLNQAWMDINAASAFKLRVGKFKTPMHWAFQVRVGQTVMPRPPATLTARVNLPFGLNAVSPTILTGFDTGVMAHGSVARGKVEYQVGIFSGEGIGANAPTSTLSDDMKLPGLLYAGRVAFAPYGPMPLREGGDERQQGTRLLVAASLSYNVEANAESSNDFRAGVEIALSRGRFYFALEAYMLQMSFVERLRGTPSQLFLGAYTQFAYRFAFGVEPVIRFEVLDRNSTAITGVSLVPAVGVNWYIFDQNLKVQAMYQFLVRSGYKDDLAAHLDDNAMPDGAFVLQLQFAL